MHHCKKITDTTNLTTSENLNKLQYAEMVSEQSGFNVLLKVVLLTDKDNQINVSTKSN